MPVPHARGTPNTSTNMRGLPNPNYHSSSTPRNHTVEKTHEEREKNPTHINNQPKHEHKKDIQLESKPRNQSEKKEHQKNSGCFCFFKPTKKQKTQIDKKENSVLRPGK